LIEPFCLPGKVSSGQSVTKMPGISAYSESVTGYRVLPYITKTQNLMWAGAPQRATAMKAAFG
jgi:hypothetical protein